MRSKNSPCVYDDYDEKISYFSKMFKSRNAFYKKISDAAGSEFKKMAEII
ncbi:hypothetical protein [Succinatimonas hippei]|nr:hypothetical protein [Succinatimonas hippei]